jgi:hypothetical protein
MRKNITIFMLAIVVVFGSISCKCKKNTTVAQQNTYEGQQVKALAPVIIYKTKANYDKNVPVILSDDKKDIVSYPDITDVYYAGKLAYPTQLADGYLLDNRGIGKNVAFLKFTYEEYSKLSSTPTKEELLGYIIDKNPLLELYKCDKLPKNNIDQLNEAISKGLANYCSNIINN